MKKYDFEELKRFSPEELNMMVEENEISWSEWVEAQPDTYDGYAGWLQKTGRERNDESARLFIQEIEENMMDEEKTVEVENCIQAVENFRTAKEKVYHAE